MMLKRRFSEYEYECRSFKVSVLRLHARDGDDMMLFVTAPAGANAPSFLGV